MSNDPMANCMSGIALIGAILMVLIMNVAPGVVPVQLTGQAHLLYVLVSLFMGVATYVILEE